LRQLKPVLFCCLYQLMGKKYVNKPQQPARPVRESIRNRLLRPSLGKKFGIAFLLFFALTAGNLIVVERLYDGAADTASIINESGRLRYISQEIAFQSARLVYEKRQDGQVIDQLAAQFEAQLDKFGLAVQQLPPIVRDEARSLPGFLGDLHQAWHGYRSVVDPIRNSPEEVDRSLVFTRLGFHSAATLSAADNVVVELTRAAAKAHSKANLIVNAILVVEVAFMLMIVLYLRHKVILPVRGVSRMFSRFASGDHSARFDFASRDEIGELAQNFNETAETVGRLIANLDIGLKVNTSLHRAARILQDERRPVAAVMQELVLMLPSAFRNPENIAARIVYEGKTFVAPGFRETPARLAADFVRGGGRQDALEVFRLDACPAGEDAFLEEEQALVKSLGEMLRSYLGRSRAQLSRGRLAAIIEATPDFVGTFMPDGRMLYINAAGRRMLGIGQADDIAGLKLADCYPEWVDTVLARVALPAAARDGIWLGETALLGRDGREIPVSQVVIAHRDENGAVNFVSGIARDIGERIELESRLTRSRDFHLKLLQHFPHMVWRSGTDGNFDYVNRTWLDFTGRKLEQELGDGWAEAVHPDDLDRCHKVYLEAFGKREPFEIEYRLRRHDGEYRWLMGNGAPYEDLNGNFAGYIGASYDITERKLAEDKARKLSLVAEKTGNSVIITDCNGMIEYVNPEFSKVTGYAFEEAIGQSPGILKSGLTAPEYYRDMWATMVSGEIWRGELLNRKKSGELFWESEVISALKNAAGEITHFIAVKEDVTERKHQEKRLRLWERAIESSVNAILITDAEVPGNPLIYANPAFERITGYSQEEALGRNCSFLQNEDTDQPAVEELRQAIREQREGRVLLRNYRKDGSLFWNELLIAPVRDESGKITHFVGIQNDVTERKAHETQLEYQANYDTLTGLANRNLFQDRLSQALISARRNDRSLAVLFIDLDNFKNINDSLGHDAGDLLLAQVAARLAGNVREGDTVARQGGDEFVLILSEIREDDDVTVVAQKILKAMSAPFDIGGRELHITCSIGIASYPKDGEDSQTLLKNADAAMYRAKELGRNNAQYYAAEMNVKAMERLVLENGLYHALERDEFLLHYQPQVDLRTGEIAGMEALVRWQHPKLGLVSPAMFIPVAEDSGLIVSLGEWVLRTACAQNKAWQLAGLKPISVAVNLSARQFRQPDLVEKVAVILDETGLDPACLELELTESLVMQDVEKTITTLGKLKAMGIKLSVDDFGTGYSSLSYLKRFPIDTLKIDQSFVRDITTDPDDAAIAKSIISMAHDMQLRVIAEGVETEAQKSFLQQRHCDEMQGYLFSRPVAAAEFETLLRETAACR
jgi:diguanylate cyclase (GGDEF)-like protein/PAS domain S-box-containing protein